jgi:hypothetical protein
MILACFGLYVKSILGMIPKKKKGILRKIPEKTKSSEENLCELRSFRLHSLIPENIQYISQIILCCN